MIRPRVIVSRVMEAGLVVVGLAVLWVGAPNAWLLIWDVLAAVYVGIWAVRLWRHRREEDPEELARRSAGHIATSAHRCWCIRCSDSSTTPRSSVSRSAW